MKGGYKMLGLILWTAVIFILIVSSIVILLFYVRERNIAYVVNFLEVETDCDYYEYRVQLGEALHDAYIERCKSDHNYKLFTVGFFMDAINYTGFRCFIFECGL